MAIECSDTFGISFTAEIEDCDLDFDERDTYNLGAGNNEFSKGFTFVRKDADSGSYLVSLSYSQTTIGGVTTTGTTPPTGVTINRAEASPAAPSFNAGRNANQAGTVYMDIDVDRDAFSGAGLASFGMTVSAGLDR